MINGNLMGSVYSTTSLSCHDGPGMRSVIFLYGCHCQCVYCHNPESWLGKFRRVSVNEMIKQCLKDQTYYGKEGGVTISGGEPLLQERFTLELIRGLKREGIHVAIDTSGLVYSEAILDEVDLVIMDIKASSQETLDQFCVGNHEMIVKNLAYISKKKIPHIYRHVIIPGMNDTLKWIISMNNFTNDRIDYLPYHNMASSKWRDLPYENKLSNQLSMTMEALESLLEKAKNKDDPRE